MILNNISRFSFYRLDYKDGIYVGNLSKYFTEYTVKRVNVYKILKDTIDKLNIKIDRDEYIVKVNEDIDSFSKMVDELRKLYYEEVFKLSYSAINEGYVKADYYLGVFDKETFEMTNVNIHYPLYNKNNFDISDYHQGELIDVRSLLKMDIRKYTIGTVIFDVYSIDNIRKRYLDRKFFSLNEEDVDKWKPILLKSYEYNDPDILVNYVTENNFYNEEMKVLLFKTFTYQNGKISFDTLSK